MATLWYLTHPQVVVDPDVPVPRWGLSPVGRARAESLSLAGFVDDLTVVWSSTETKARETAAAVVGSREVPVLEREDLGENDRRSTGFLPSEEFERVADAFFARPTESVRGWERAVDAQARVVAAVREVLTDPRSGDGDVLVVGHGAVGTLLLCHLLGVPVTRQLDQRGPGGMLHSADRATLRPHHRAWRSIEDVVGHGE